MNANVRRLIDETGDSGDRWASVMSAFFSIANAFYLNGGTGLGNTYAPWGYRASPLLRDSAVHREEDPFMSELLDMMDAGSITMLELRHAGDVLNRYTGMLDTAGESY